MVGEFVDSSSRLVGTDRGSGRSLFNFSEIIYSVRRQELLVLILIG